MRELLENENYVGVTKEGFPIFPSTSSPLIFVLVLIFHHIFTFLIDKFYLKHNHNSDELTKFSF